MDNKTRLMQAKGIADNIFGNTDVSAEQTREDLMDLREYVQEIIDAIDEEDMGR